MAKKTAALTVIITDVSPSDGALTGEVTAGLGSGPYINPNKKSGLRFPKKDTYDITFDLADQTGYGLHFPVSPDVPADALWIGPDNICPVQTAGDGNGAFQVTSVTRDRLTVYDANKSAENFMYMLRFRSDQQPTKWFWLDPVVENGGGGGQLHYAVTAAIVVAVTAIVLVGAALMLD